MYFAVRTFACLLLCCLCSGAFAQQPVYPFSRIDITNGLSHNRVTCIYKDHKGFMWFGTIAGLNRYDGHTFKVFTHDSQDPLSLADNYIMHIYELPGNRMFIQSRNGRSIYDPTLESFTDASTWLRNAGLPVWPVTSIVNTPNACWFLYADGSIYKLLDDKKVQAIQQADNDAYGVGSSVITDIKADSKNNLLAVHRNGIIEKIDAVSNKVIFRTGVIQKMLGSGQYNFSMYADRQDDIWLFVPALPFGVFYYNAFSNEAKRLNKETGILNNNIVSGIVQDDKGVEWIGTDHGGVNMVDKKTFKADYIRNKEEDNASVSQNVITTLYKDSTGIIWLGTYKRGINYFRENISRFPLYRHLLTDKNSLSYDDVNRFVEDAKGNLWIGTNGGGLIYFNRAANTFTQYKHDAANSNTISNDVIVSLWVDHEQKLWIGSYFGGLDCYDGNKFIHYKHDDANPASLTEDRVWEIYEDAKLNLWVGTFNGGLDRFDRKANVFYHYKKGRANSVSSDYISSFAEDTKGNLWVGTDAGIDVLQANTDKFIHLQAGSISNDDVIALLRDADNNIWIGARNGLSVFNIKTGGFQYYSMQDGLPDNCILNILQDNDKKIWISTPKGLSKISFTYNNNKIALACKNYDEMDGLQGRDFNENAAYKTRQGELLFGGANGFNIFNPATINANNRIPPVVFTDFQLFNKSVRVGENTGSHLLLQQSVSEVKEITLHYNENVFSIEFAALSFDNTEKDKYVFKLEGFDKQWLTARGKSRRATYTNLDPGEYYFHVKASNDNGLWNENGATIKIIVKPPFWRAPAAYVVYVLLIAAALIFGRKMIIKRTRARFLIDEERKEAQRLHELDMLKIKFFTNVSHEFRTPLSLILTPLDKIIRQAHEPEQKKQLQVIQRNGKRLLNLVNQLLDFRKMEVEELRLNLQQGNVARFIREISYSFTDVAEKKNIQFDFACNRENFITVFDPDKLERILFNLLSNAFKFTAENGKISITVNIPAKEGELTEIRVKDTGIGIPKEKQEKIFERFFQSEVPGTMLNQGSGIGLSITKEFVRLYGGNIVVESEVDAGTCFIVQLPLKEVQETVNGLDVQLANIATADAEVAEEQAALFAEEPAKNKQAKKKKQVVLLVEDNEDFLFYLKDNLREFYTILEAGNGKKGWQKVLAEHPDLVVSDISMPVMDGIELCRKIKTDIRTRHIPVILLTALAGDDKHVEGLETGASDYITKPFNFEIMLSRIRNILEGQKSLKKVLGKQVEVKTTEVAVASHDEKFVQQALDIVEKNLANPDFSVEELSRELYMSRVAVYKKIFALTGKSPIDFIRSIRLQRAAQLLEKSDLSVAEIAWEVGFNNPKYFSKFFKAEYNVVPSEYAAEKRG